RLNEQSNAINKGKRLGSDIGTVDFYGNNRVVGAQVDIGAAEYDFPRLEVPVTPQPTEPSNPGDNGEITNIKIDGFLDDWAAFPILASGTKNLKELKATVENANLYVSIKGRLLKEKGQLYVYLPDSNKQAFEVPHWSNKQAHYLIENGIVYEYTGTGKNWMWNKVTSLTRDQIVINNDAIEYAIPFAILGSSQIIDIHLGYIWKDTKGDQLPSGGNMLIINTAEQLVTPTPQNIEIDGFFNDWDKVTVWDKDTNTSLKVTNDAQYLYFYMNTNSKIVKEQFYLNADNDVTTGHSNTVWEKGSGIDYLVEKGIIYKYTGNKKNWSY